MNTKEYASNISDLRVKEWIPPDFDSPVVDKLVFWIYSKFLECPNPENILNSEIRPVFEHHLLTNACRVAFYVASRAYTLFHLRN